MVVPRVMRSRSPTLPKATLVVPLLLHPGAEEDRDCFGDPSLPSDPVSHRPGGDSQSGGRSHLAQLEAFQCPAQLVGGHGHGSINIGPTYLRLADRHIVPTFSA